MHALPDSGADITAANTSTLTALGDCIDNLVPSPLMNAYSVDGSTFQALGQMTISVTMGDVTVNDTLHQWFSTGVPFAIRWGAASTLFVCLGKKVECCDVILKYKLQFILIEK